MNEPSISIADPRRCRWPTKLWLGSALGIVLYGGYFYLNHHPSRAPVRFSPTAIDTWVGFSPGWTAMYLSLYLMLPVGWLVNTREELTRYSAGIAGVMATGFVCFLLWPVAGPRPVDGPTDGLYGLLVRWDHPANSFPSLHVALAIYSVCIGIELTAGPTRRVTGAALSIWAILIAYATLATKQHYWVDLPPGALLGWAGWRLAWRGWPGTPRSSVTVSPLQSSGK